MPAGFRTGPGATSGFRTRPGGSGGFRGGPGSRKKGGGFFDDVFGTLAGATGIGPLLLSEFGPDKYSRGVGRVGSVLSSAPLAAVTSPWATTEGAFTALRGLFEAPAATYYGIREFGGKGFLDMLWEGIKQDYQYRYGEDWRKAAREEPINNLFDALTVFGIAARAGALGGAASRLSKANITRTPRSIWQESARPGLLSEGKPWVRELEYQLPTGEVARAEQPFARGPVRRGTQLLADYLSSSMPEAPIFGVESRIARTQARTLARDFERLRGAPRGIDAVDKLPDAGRWRLFWGAQIGDHSQQGLQQVKAWMDDLLNGEDAGIDAIEEPEFADFLRQAKKTAFGKQLLDHLDEAIAYEPDDRYWRAAEAMRDVTGIAEDVIASANGFDSMHTDLVRARDRYDRLEPGSEEHTKTADEIDVLEEALSGKEDELRQMFHNRRNLVREALDTWRNRDIPERLEWIEELAGRENLTPDQVDELIAFADAMANVRPDPAQFWASRIGRPSGESAEDFMGRASEAFLQEPGMRRMVEGIVEKGVERQDFYYSPLQRWLAKQEWKKMKPQSLEATIRKAIPDHEFYNAGLDLYFDEHRGDAVIYREDFLNHLASPMNAYNLEERLLSNFPLEELPDESYMTRWNRYANGGLISRDPALREYYELVMRLPGEGRDRPFTDAGIAHWRLENVVAHARFHVFGEGGVGKLLIEEVQGDWARAERKAAKRGEVYRTPSEEDQVRLREIDRQLSEIGDQVRPLHEENWRLHQEIDMLRREDIPEGPEALERDENVALLRAQKDEVERKIDYLEDRSLDLGEESYRLGRLGIPPSPLGPKYYRAVLRRLVREAAEQNVDEIILTDPTTQFIRNTHEHIPEMERTPTHAAADVRASLHGRGLGFPASLYRDEFPKFLEKEYGVKGEWKADAYNGRYANQLEQFSHQGPMPGLVFRVTPEMKEKALKPQPLYQHQPDWNGLPKGANELLANGDRVVHMFETADVSTWIHELAHSALFDLGADDLRHIEAHFGGGKQLSAWKDSHHENFARSFEMWVREGRAPNSRLQRVFTRIGKWMQAIYRQVDSQYELPPEVRAVFERMFLHEDAPDTFMPHRPGRPDIGGGRTTKGIPRAQRVIGDRTFSRIPLFRRNQLALLRGGLLHDDPRVLFEHFDRVVALARANQLREAVLELAEPLPPGELPDFKGIHGPAEYAIKRAGRGVDQVTFDAMDAADNPEEIAETIRGYIDDNIKGDADRWEAWAGDNQIYVVDKRYVDLLFKNVTGKTPGATTKPSGTPGIVADAVLDSMRGLLLYGNPGFYASNMIGNAWMMATKNPSSFKHMRWSMSNAMKAAFGEDTSDHLWNRISIEMGRGPTAGGMSYRPEAVGRGRGRSGRVLKRGSEEVSYRLGRYGRRAGRIVDDSFRVAAWKTTAAKHGYDTDAKITKLLDDATGQKGRMMDADSKERRDLAAIRDEAENLMLDFDSMTPFERSYLSRIIFLYPFLRASTKYPFMFMGERPVTAGLLGQSGLQGSAFAEGVYGPRPDLPGWAAGYARVPGGFLNVGSFMPFTAGADITESLLGLGQPTPIGVNRPFAYLNPGIQLVYEMLRSQNKYGRDASLVDILRQDAPAPAYLSQLIWGREPSQIYSDRGRMDALLRSLRVVPFGLEE